MLRELLEERERVRESEERGTCEKLVILCWRALNFLASLIVLFCGWSAIVVTAMYSQDLEETLDGIQFL